MPSSYSRTVALTLRRILSPLRRRQAGDKHAASSGKSHAHLLRPRIWFLSRYIAFPRPLLSAIMKTNHFPLSYSTATFIGARSWSRTRPPAHQRPNAPPRRGNFPWTILPMESRLPLLILAWLGWTRCTRTVNWTCGGHHSTRRFSKAKVSVALIRTCVLVNIQKI